MKNKEKLMLIHPEPRIHKGDVTEIACVFEITGRKPERLWYQIPAWAEGWVTEMSDPFVIALVQRAMHERTPIRVRGTVSPSLIRNLHDFQAVWAMWRPGFYHPVDIRAEREREHDHQRPMEEAVFGFSGGVDSAFTAFRHATATGIHPPWPLKTGVMVHGFDIPLDQEEGYQSALDKGQRMLDSIGLSLIPVATNYRAHEVLWSNQYGAAVASCLALFQGRFSTGLIGQGVPYKWYLHFLEGSNPLSDPLLSSSGFRVVPDGSGYQRADKIDLMAGWPEFRKYLRVCWAGTEKDRNCCRCEKCIRNILVFRLLGHGLPECFPEDVSVEQIRNLRGIKKIKLNVEYDNILRMARLDQWKHEAWAKELRKTIKRNWKAVKFHRSSWSYQLRSVADLFTRR